MPGLGNMQTPVAIWKVRVSWKVFATPAQTFLMATKMYTFHDTGGGSVPRCYAGMSPEVRRYSLYTIAQNETAAVEGGQGVI